MEHHSLKTLSSRHFSTETSSHLSLLWAYAWNKLIDWLIDFYSETSFLGLGGLPIVDIATLWIRQIQAWATSLNVMWLSILDNMISIFSYFVPRIYLWIHLETPKVWVVARYVMLRKHRWRMRDSSVARTDVMFCLFFVVDADDWKRKSVRRRTAMHVCRRTRWSGVIWPAWPDSKTTRAFLSVRFRARTNCFKSCLPVSTKSSADLSPQSRIQGLYKVSCWRPTLGYAEPLYLSAPRSSRGSTNCAIIVFAIVVIRSTVATGYRTVKTVL